jgi:hypothetical protein
MSLFLRVIFASYIFILLLVGSFLSGLEKCLATFFWPSWYLKRNPLYSKVLFLYMYCVVGLGLSRFLLSFWFLEV